MRLAYLSSENTLPGSPRRRSDAYEHDQMMEALSPALADHGIALDAVAWDDGNADWARYGMAVIGTAWDYCDRPDAFLRALRRIGEACPHGVLNPPDLAAWNMDKRYLKALRARGVATVQTDWISDPSPGRVSAAFDRLGADEIVVKRQIGAGAEGQHRLRRGEAVPELARPVLAQPFLPAIESEGEYSFVFVDGAFSHALVKRPAPGDYRIQSSYGGTEAPHTPEEADFIAAASVLRELGDVPLYARVDMVRLASGALALMELELIEPFLYPLQGPRLGLMMAKALAKRAGLL